MPQRLGMNRGNELRADQAHADQRFLSLHDSILSTRINGLTSSGRNAFAAVRSLWFVYWVRLLWFIDYQHRRAIGNLPGLARVAGHVVAGVAVEHETVVRMVTGCPEADGQREV